jgi:hypothetical protein
MVQTIDKKKGTKKKNEYERAIKKEGQRKRRVGGRNGSA